MFDMREQNETVFDFEAYFVKMGSEMIRKMSRRGKLIKAISGYCPYAAVYGYKRNKRTTMLEIDEPAADVVRRIFTMFVSGTKLSEIAKTLNEEGVVTPKVYKEMLHGYDLQYYYGRPEWSTSSIKAILNNRIYIGLILWGKSYINSEGQKVLVSSENIQVYKGVHEPIIDREMFDSATVMLFRNSLR